MSSFLKKYMSLGSFLLILLVLIFFPKNVRASESFEEIFTLESVTSDNNKFVLESEEIKPLDDHKNVYCVTASVGSGFFGNKLTFSGKTKDNTVELKVDTRNKYGHNEQYKKDTVSNLTVIDNEYQFIFNKNSDNANNVVVVYITATYQKKDYDYVIIVCPTNTIKQNITLKDAENNNIIYEANTSDGAKIFNKIDVSSDVEYISVKCDRESTKTTAYNSVAWVVDGENYIRANNDSYHRLDGSGTRLGDNWSPDVKLNDGINIIDVCLETYKSNTDVKQMNVASASYKEGLSLYRNQVKEYSTYLIYKEPSSITRDKAKSNDTSIKYVEATQMTNTGSVPATQFSVEYDNEKDEYSINMPSSAPEANGSTYNKCILGIIPSDPNATVEYLDEDPENYTVCGDQIGMYQAMRYTNADGSVKKSFRIKVTAENGTEKIHTIRLKQEVPDFTQLSIDLRNATLKDYSNKASASFMADKHFYQYKPSGNVTANIIIPKNATVYIDGQKAEENSAGYYDIDTDKLATIIKIVSADNVTSEKYYFVREDADGTVPIDGQTETTKDQIKLMLTGWNNRSTELKKNLTDDYSAYWDVFMSAATNVDMKNAVAYDVESHTMNQGSDWAACILELVMTGKNPYNYNGKNYVEGLKKCKDSNGSYGPFACNVWALQAFKVCGEPIEESLIEKVLTNAKSNAIADDIRPWAIAALTDVVPKETIIALTLDMKETQQNNGLWGNAYTNGCYLSAIGAANVNIDYFDVSQGTVLKQFAKNYMTEDYKFIYVGEADSYVKDAIIGLGDMYYARSVYNSYSLNNSKLNDLISVAKSKDNSSEDLAKAISAAEAVKDQDNGFGKEYYDLLEALSVVDNSYDLQVRYCSWEDSQNIDAVITNIDNLGEITLSSKDKVVEARKSYDALNKDHLKSYVSNADKLEKAESTIIVLTVEKQIADLPKDIAAADVASVKAAQKAYDALTDEQKKELAEKNPGSVSKLQTATEKVAEIEKNPNDNPSDKPQEDKTEDKPADNGNTQKPVVKVGDVIKGKVYNYKITSVSSKSLEVAFTGAKSKNITKVSVPATVKYNGKTYKVTAIASNACKNYKKLKSVVISKNIKTVGAKSFYGCKKLSKITFKTNVLKKVGSQAFKGIYKKAVMKVPAKKLSKYKKLLKGKGQKKTVKIKK